MKPPPIFITHDIEKSPIHMKTFITQANFPLLLITLLFPFLCNADEWAPGEKELFGKYLALKKEGRYADALVPCKKWVALCERVYGPDDSLTIFSLNGLAGLYYDLVYYRTSERLYQRVLAIREKNLGPEHPDTAESLNNLASLYQSMGYFAKSELLDKRALAIREKVLGPEHLSTAMSLANLGALYQGMGRYEKAEPLLERALAIREKVSGPDSLDTANSLYNLAALHDTTGNYTKAILLRERASTILAKTLGREHPTSATNLDSLAGSYSSIGEYLKAKGISERALVIREKILGRKHPDTATNLQNLGFFYAGLGDYANAEIHYSLAFAVYEEFLGPEAPANAIVLNNLAEIYRFMGDYPKAERFYARALAKCEKNEGPKDADTIVILTNLAYCQIAMGNHEEAQPLVRRGETAFRTRWRQFLSFTSENGKQAAFSTLPSLELPGALGDGLIAAESLLWRKGAILESLIDERRVATAADADPGLAKTLQEVTALKDTLRLTIMEGPKAQFTKEEVAGIESELDALQKEVARKVSDYGLSGKFLDLRIEQVQAAIPKGSAVIDFMRYSHYLGKKDSEDRYAAVLIAPDITPLFISLGKAETIENTLAQWRKLSGREIKDSEKASGLNGQMELLCKELHRLIGQPIEKALPPDTRELILCPDGQLHFLAFGSLLDDSASGQLWAEKFTLRNVSTARDLLKSPRPSDEKKREIVLVGNPDYNHVTPEVANRNVREAEERERVKYALTRGGQREEMRGMSFDPLPGASAEVKALKERSEKSGWRAPTLEDAKATEPALRKMVNSPTILHLATHGFFLNELNLGEAMARERERLPNFDGAPQTVSIRDPMLRSGLALCGAKTTMSLWEEGQVPPLAEDGILTAAEVASLRLDGTRLVTLSACETGLGEAMNGEGVLGLQRAIALAGAETLLMTLWNISDQDTSALMGEFYERVLAGQHPARAFPEVQREFLIRLRKEHGLWWAINRAAPFVIVSNSAVPPLEKE